VSNDALALAVVAVAVLAVSRRARRAAWAVLRGAVGAVLAVAALVVERRRLGRPARQLPPGHVWKCTVYLAHGRRMVALSPPAVITGPWTTSADVEAEAMARVVAALGYPKVGMLCARAEPVAVAVGHSSPSHSRSS
jgi:hypothetical protein